MPNIGLFVGFNLPIKRAKHRSGVVEVGERVLADAKLYGVRRYERDSEIHDFTT